MLTGNSVLSRMPRSFGEKLAGLWFMFRWIGLRGWIATALGTLATLVFIGVPAAIIRNPVFIRMTPTRPQDYVIWVATAIMVGLILGTYFTPLQKAGQGKVVSGGLLSFLAVGCPICNKLVVLLLGISGAMTFFAPAQLYIGIGSLVLMGWALQQRVRAVRGACDVGLKPGKTNQPSG